MKENVEFGKIKISLQALVILFWGAVLFFMLLILSPYLGLAGLILIMPILLNAYQVNCMVNGQCKIWAWILAMVFTFCTILCVVCVMILYRDHKLDLLRNLLEGQVTLKEVKKQLSSR
jgi:hypothetical protein